MAGKDELDRWWGGLTEQQQTDAIRSSDAGQLSETTEESLGTAGLITQGKRKDRTIPGDIDEYLKMRH